MRECRAVGCARACVTHRTWRRHLSFDLLMMSNNTRHLAATVALAYLDMLSARGRCSITSSFPRSSRSLTTCYCGHVILTQVASREEKDTERANQQMHIHAWAHFATGRQLDISSTAAGGTHHVSFCLQYLPAQQSFQSFHHKHPPPAPVQAEAILRGVTLLASHTRSNTIAAPTPTSTRRPLRTPRRLPGPMWLFQILSRGLPRSRLSP